MSGLKNTWRRSGNFILGKGYTTKKERDRKKAAQRQAELDKVYQGAQIPDEEEIQRDERRKAAKRRGSRADTILTEDTLG